MRAITGLVGVNQGHGAASTVATRAATATVHAPDGAGARGRGRPGRADRAPARPLRRRPPRHRRPRQRRTRRWPRSGCSTSPIGGVDGFSKGMRQRTKVAAALVERSAGAGARRAAQRRRPGAAAQPDHAVPPARRRGAHGDRQLARAQRGRATGRARHRPRARPAGRGRRPPGDPRRHGRPPPPRARPGRRPPPAGRRARRPRLRGRRHVRRDPGRARHPDRTGRRARHGPAPPRPRRRRSGCSRSAPSTTRSRACSGSWCDDALRPHAAVATAAPVVHRSGTRARRPRQAGCARLRDHRLHAAVVHPAAALGGGPRCRAPAPSCSGCWPTPSTRRPTGPSPTSPPRASSASPCRSPRWSSATPCSAPRSAAAPSASRGCRRRRSGRSSSAGGSAARSWPS